MYKVVMLLVSGCFFLSTLSQSVNAAQTVGSAKLGDVVILECARFGTPLAYRVLTDTRSPNAGVPSSNLDNCAEVLSQLQTAGFIIVSIDPTEIGSNIVYTLNR